MLKGISPLISPELLKVLDEMGHGDEIVLADANFPSSSIGQRVIRADGIGTAELLAAILPLFPLGSVRSRAFRPDGGRAGRYGCTGDLGGL